MVFKDLAVTWCVKRAVFHRVEYRAVSRGGDACNFDPPHRNPLAKAR
jgi:hypothetical protein